MPVRNPILLLNTSSIRRAVLAALLAVTLSACSSVLRNPLPADVYEQRAADFKDLILWITLIYFISGTIWMGRWQKLKERTAET